ncbi:Multiple ankyrin repeats single kh domain [Mycena kentingensis (nom. inval.)]|nr:Multiple ankyrin repeats single kh domain [Mycena kentingensis (nom. inval.)]
MSFCTNTDISGIGVRTATYAQNLLSFFPAVLAIIDDHKISATERELIEDQSTNILITAFALLISAIIQTKTGDGLDNYHLALVLNLSWMNNTNTFIYLFLRLHRGSWRGSEEVSDAEAGVGRHDANDDDGGVHLAPNPQAPNQAASNTLLWRQYSRFKDMGWLDMPVIIGTLHLSFMGGVGLWLWSNPRDFGTSSGCIGSPTLSVFGHAIPLLSPWLRFIFIPLYALAALPGINIFLPAVLSKSLAPFVFTRLVGVWIPEPSLSDGLLTASHIGLAGAVAETPRVSHQRTFQRLPRNFTEQHGDKISIILLYLSLAGLLAVNIAIIVDTEVTIKHNNRRQEGADQVWSLGQVLALLLVVLPLKSIGTYVKRTIVWRFAPQSKLGRAMRGFRRCDESKSWADVQRWMFVIRDTPIPEVDATWLNRAARDDQLHVIQFLSRHVTSVDVVDLSGLTALEWAIALKYDAVVHGLRKLGAAGRAVMSPLPNNSQLLQLAVQHQYRGAVERMLLFRPNIDVRLMSLCTDATIYQLLCDAGAQLDYTDGSGRTPLILTAMENRVAATKLLLASRVRIDHRDTQGKTAFHWAAETGSLEVLKELQPVDGQSSGLPDSEGNTPIHLAAREQRILVVNYLLQNCTITVNAQNRKKETALHLAAANGPANAVKCLLDAGFSCVIKDNDKNFPLHNAAASGDNESVTYLITARPGYRDMINKDGRTPLHRAALGREPAILRTLLEHDKGGIDMRDYLGKTALLVACDESRSQLAHISILLEYGASVTATDAAGYIPLHFAARPHGVKAVRMLLEYDTASDVEGKPTQEKPTVNTRGGDGYTPLHFAAQLHAVEVVQILLEHGADVNRKSDRGWSPLYTAAQNGSFACIPLLIKAGGVIDAKETDKGWTPLHIATRYARTEAVKVLLENGANRASQDHSGEIPLHLACTKAIAQQLVTGHEKTVNTGNNRGSTPVHHAAARNSDVLQVLLDLGDAGDSIEAQDQDGRTPLHAALASSEPNIKCIKLLKSHGAKVDAQALEGARNRPDILAVLQGHH